MPRSYNDAALAGGAYNEAALLGGAYNTAALLGGAYNDAALLGGAYNDAALLGGAYNDAALMGGAYNDAALQGGFLSFEDAVGVDLNKSLTNLPGRKICLGGRIIYDAIMSGITPAQRKRLERIANKFQQQWVVKMKGPNTMKSFIEFLFGCVYLLDSFRISYLFLQEEYNAIDDKKRKAAIKEAMYEEKARMAYFRGRLTKSGVLSAVRSAQNIMHSIMSGSERGFLANPNSPYRPGLVLKALPFSGIGKEKGKFPGFTMRGYDGGDDDDEGDDGYDDEDGEMEFVTDEDEPPPEDEEDEEEGDDGEIEFVPEEGYDDEGNEIGNDGQIEFVPEEGYDDEGNEIGNDDIPPPARPAAASMTPEEIAAVEAAKNNVPPEKQAPPSATNIAPQPPVPVDGTNVVVQPHDPAAEQLSDDAHDINQNLQKDAQQIAKNVVAQDPPTMEAAYAQVARETLADAVQQVSEAFNQAADGESSLPVQIATTVTFGLAQYAQDKLKPEQLTAAMGAAVTAVLGALSKGIEANVAMEAGYKVLDAVPEAAASGLNVAKAAADQGADPAMQINVAVAESSDQVGNAVTQALTEAGVPPTEAQDVGTATTVVVGNQSFGKKKKGARLSATLRLLLDTYGGNPQKLMDMDDSIVPKKIKDEIRQKMELVGGALCGGRIALNTDWIFGGSALVTPEEYLFLTGGQDLEGGFLGIHWFESAEEKAARLERERQEEERKKQEEEKKRQQRAKYEAHQAELKRKEEERQKYIEEHPEYEGYQQYDPSKYKSVEGESYSEAIKRYFGMAKEKVGDHLKGTILDELEGVEGPIAWHTLAAHADEAAGVKAKQFQMFIPEKYRGIDSLGGKVFQACKLVYSNMPVIGTAMATKDLWMPVAMKAASLVGAVAPKVGNALATATGKLFRWGASKLGISEETQEKVASTTYSVASTAVNATVAAGKFAMKTAELGYNMVNRLNDLTKGTRAAINNTAISAAQTGLNAIGTAATMMGVPGASMVTGAISSGLDYARPGQISGAINSVVAPDSIKQLLHPNVPETSLTQAPPMEVGSTDTKLTVNPEPSKISATPLNFGAKAQLPTVIEEKRPVPTNPEYSTKVAATATPARVVRRLARPSRPPAPMMPPAKKVRKTSLLGPPKPLRKPPARKAPARKAAPKKSAVKKTATKRTNKRK